MSAPSSSKGQTFYALNGGPQIYLYPGHLTLRELPRRKAEVDEFVGEASAGRPTEPVRLAAGQIRLSWQIIPSALGKMLGDKDRRSQPRDAGHAASG